MRIDGIISSSSICLNTFTTWVQNSFVYCPILDFMHTFVLKTLVKVCNISYYELFFFCKNGWYKMNVFIEVLEVPLCVRNRILRIKNITKLDIEYFIYF